MNNFYIVGDNVIQHHGILGMKWGVRRYQNEDGSLTDAGRKRYRLSNHDADYKNYSLEESISRDLLKEEMRKSANSNEFGTVDLKDIHSDFIDNYKNEYLKDIEGQLPKKIKGIDSEKYMQYIADRRVNTLSYEVESEKAAEDIANILKATKADGQAYVYADYADKISQSGDRESKEEYVKNGYMSNGERKAFDILETKLKGLDDKEKSRILRNISSTFNGYHRDDSSLLIYDPKKNKIIAYPSRSENGNVHKIPEMEKLLNNQDLWIFDWGEEYDGY